MRRRPPKVRGLAVALLLAGVPPGAAQGQDPARTPPPADSIRARLEALDLPPVRVDPPLVRETRVLGVPVFHLEDSALPLVDLMVRFEGGYAHFGRENYAAATGLPGFLRNGGTRALPPDSVEARVEALALQLTFGSGGGAISSTLNTLRAALDPALDLWWSMLTEPRFDSAVVEGWRGRQLEAGRRSADDPASLAFGQFNRLMYGDDPIGWELSPGDLTPAALKAARLDALHRSIVCRDNLTVGVAGDLSPAEVAARLRPLIERVPPCPAPLPERPDPTVRRVGGVFLIPRALEQSTVVVAHATDLAQADDPAWFASRVGNAILGGGGLSNRLMTRLRTQEGFVYSVSSLWTTPRDYPGLLGATTRTASATTAATVGLVLDLFTEMARAGPSATEVQEAIDEAVNGFVFSFDLPATTVSRRMADHAAGLPPDWAERTLAGIRTVTPEQVRDVFRAHLDRERMAVLVVGDRDQLEGPLAELGLGPVVILDPDSGAATPSGPSESRRSRR